MAKFSTAIYIHSQRILCNFVLEYTILLIEMIKTIPKSFFFLIAVLLIAITIILYIIKDIYVSARNQTLSQFNQHQEVLVKQASLSLEIYLQERIRALEVLADFPASKQLDFPISLSEYERTYIKVKGFESIQFIDSMGNVDHGYPEENIFHTNILEDSLHFGKYSNFFYELQNSQSSIITPLIYSSNQEEIIYLMSPVYEENHFRGIILGELKIKPSIMQSIEPIFDDYQGSCWIMQGSGELVYHPHHEELLFASVRTPKNSCIECHGDFKHEIQIIDEKTGSMMNAGIHHNYVASYATLSIPNINWHIVVSMPVDMVQSVVKRTSQELLLLGTIVIVFVVFISIIAGYNLIGRTKAEAQTLYLEKEMHIQNEKILLETRYQTLVENLQDGIFISEKKRITLVNQSFCSILGIQREDIQRKTIRIEDFIYPSDLESLNNYKQSVIKGLKAPEFVELGGIIKNNVKIDLILVLSKFEINNQRFIQGILRDVTEIKRLAKEKNQREHLAFLGEMSARVAHEIKNPLASIQTGIQVLKQRIKGFTKEQEYCDRIIGEIKRTDSIIRSLLSYARQPELKKEQISISLILHEVLQVMEQTLKQKHIKLTIVESKNLPVLNIDVSAWKQIFWNLLDNAIQATSEGDEIAVSFTTDGLVEGDRYLIITIEDSGKGLPEGMENRIFDPFFSTRSQGTGLGLAISKRLVEMHHGKISAAPLQSGGSRFQISLPIN